MKIWVFCLRQIKQTEHRKKAGALGPWAQGTKQCQVPGFSLASDILELKLLVTAPPPRTDKAPGKPILSRKADRTLRE
jgi:hypothetical protein